ncbi:MAG: ComEC/Rec2 family competence protein [Silanimonas sp.]
MALGQGRPLTLDAGWAAALCGGVLAQLYAPALLSTPFAVALLVVAMLAILATAITSQRCADVVADGIPRRGRARLVRALSIAGAFALGAALCALQGQTALSGRLPDALDGATVRVDVRIHGLPEADDRSTRFVVDVERVLAASPVVARAIEGRRLALGWYGGGRSLRPGERWRLTLRLRRWAPPRNPGDPDAMREALVDRLAASAQVLASERPLRLGAPEGLHALRDAVSMRAVVALGAADARFVAALAVGDTRGLSDADWNRLRQFGLTHLIAISGFHVGMVAGLGVLAVRALWWGWPALATRWRRKPVAAAAALVTATAYAAIAGFSLPTVRTVLMVGVVAMVIVLRRRTTVSQPLLIAIAALAALDPFALLTPGFWLSCGGVAWLLWCLPGVSDAWSPRTFLKAQWVATLGLLPLGAAFFLQVPIAGPLANLVAIPWISLVVVPLCLLGTLLAPLSEGLSAGVWGAAAAAMDGLWAALALVPEPLAASRWLPELSAWTAALALLGVAIALLPRGLAWRHVGWVLVLPLLVPPMPRVPDGEFSVTAFALPRGDAVLVRTATRSVLVDAGPAALDLPRRLRAVGVERIDLRIETRRSAGRLGGAAANDAAFPPSRHWRAPGEASAAASASTCVAGQRWAADGVEILAVSPGAEAAGATPDEACVLRVTDARGQIIWLSSEAGPWVARRLAQPASGGWVIGAPAALGAWQSAMRAEGAIATRAPGPSLSRRWPGDLHRVDESGALTWRSDAPHAPRASREGARRWWHPPPR